MLSGRAGAGIATELGTMRITELIASVTTLVMDYFLSDILPTLRDT